MIVYVCNGCECEMTLKDVIKVGIQMGAEKETVHFCRTCYNKIKKFVNESLSDDSLEEEGELDEAIVEEEQVVENGATVAEERTKEEPIPNQDATADAAHNNEGTPVLRQDKIEIHHNKAPLNGTVPTDLRVKWKTASFVEAIDNALAENPNVSPAKLAKELNVPYSAVYGYIKSRRKR